MKRVVWDSPFQLEATNLDTGITFRRGEPQNIPDADAEKLLGLGADGKPHSPYFHEVDEQGAYITAEAPAPPPGLKSSIHPEDHEGGVS